jgi:hypothetical protein
VVAAHALLALQASRAGSSVPKGKGHGIRARLHVCKQRLQATARLQATSCCRVGGGLLGTAGQQRGVASGRVCRPHARQSSAASYGVQRATAAAAAHSLYPRLAGHAGYPPPLPAAAITITMTWQMQQRQRPWAGCCRRCQAPLPLTGGQLAAAGRVRIGIGILGAAAARARLSPPPCGTAPARACAPPPGGGWWRCHARPPSRASCPPRTLPCRPPPRWPAARGGGGRGGGGRERAGGPTGALCKGACRECCGGRAHMRPAADPRRAALPWASSGAANCRRRPAVCPAGQAARGACLLQRQAPPHVGGQRGQLLLGDVPAGHGLPRLALLGPCGCGCCGCGCWWCCGRCCACLRPGARGLRGACRGRGRGGG